MIFIMSVQDGSFQVSCIFDVRKFSFLYTEEQWNEYTENAWEAYQDAAIRIILLAGKFNIQKNGREYLNKFNSVQLSNAYGPVILEMSGNGNQSDWLKATDDLCSIFSTTDSDETKSGDSS